MNPRIRIILAFGMLFFFALLIWKPAITGHATSDEPQRVVVILKASASNGITGASAFEESGLSLEELGVATKIAQEEVLADVNSPSLLDQLTGNTEPDVEAERTLDIVPAMVVEATADGIAELKAHPLVEAVYPNVQFELSLAESVPLINADDVWQLQVEGVPVDGRDVSVCVIDTGISPHSAFQSRIVDQKCFCAPNCCPNGQATDVIATDTHSSSHGTHVSGIIGANGPTYKGVAPGVNIIAVKVCSSSCGLADIISGLDYCLQQKQAHNVVAISGSLGDGGNYQAQEQCPTYLDSAIDAAFNAGIVSVFASGNNGYTNGVSYPGCNPNAIAVGATDKSDVIASFTNRGVLLDVLAPGVSIISTKASETYGTLSGTSQATPHVSGVAALMYQVAQALNTPLTPDQIRQTLQDTGVLIGGWKRVDAMAAVQTLIPSNAPPTAAISAPVESAVAQSPVTLEGSASDAEDGSIPAEGLAWTSDIDGSLGTGTSLQAALSAGQHAITLTATDSGSLTDDAVVHVTVQVPPPPNTPPVAAVSVPVENAVVQSPVQLEGSATDAEDGVLSDEALSWTSDVDGNLGTGTSLQVALSVGPHTITLTATDSGSLTGQEVVHITVEQPPDDPPTAVISSPAENAVLESPVQLDGSGSDSEDGALAPEQLSWSSDIDGSLGTGNSLQAPLSPGQHTITLTATDSSNQIDTEVVHVTVLTPNTPPNAAITAPADNAVLQNPITFTGTADDAEDGALQGTWKENVNVLGVGSPLVKLLSPGIHTITFTATDSSSSTVEDTVTFTAQTCHVALDNNAEAGVDIGDFVVLLGLFASENLQCIAPQSGCIIELDRNGNGLVDIGDFISLLTAFSQNAIQDISSQTC